jgi:hypothetical protein
MENEDGILVQPVYVVCDESSYKSDDENVTDCSITLMFTVNPRSILKNLKLTVHSLFILMRRPDKVALRICSSIPMC